MFQRIVVPLDGSARSARAGGQMLLLEVVSTPTDYSGGLVPAAPMVLEEQIESEIPIA